MELDGLKLPLMLVLYRNTPELYKSMRNNKQFIEKQAKVVGGPVNYKDFWKWTKATYNGWGNWIKQNVTKNFPELSKTTLSI